MPWYGLQVHAHRQRQLIDTIPQSAPVGKRCGVHSRPLLTQFIIRIKWLKYNHWADRARVSAFDVTEGHASRSCPLARRLRLSGATELSFVTAGDASKPAVLLLHGFRSSARTFRDVVPELSQAAHLIAVRRSRSCWTGSRSGRSISTFMTSVLPVGCELRGSVRRNR